VFFLASNHNPTLRTLAVLELISTKGQAFSLSEISRQLGLSVSTLFPILHTLHEQKYLAFDEKTKTYSLGLRLFEIGSRVQATHSYQEIYSIMNGIVQACGETCHFGTLDKGDVLYLAKVDSTQPIRMFSMIGRRLPAYGTGLGKALLKGYSIEDLKVIYPEGLKPLTKNTITDFETLHHQLHTNDIFVYECEESNEFIRCIAIPIYRQGMVVASCSVAIPIFRYNEQKELDVKNALKHALIQFEKIVHCMIF